MPVLSDYVAGTITLTTGVSAFTGSGTGWLSAGFREGDTIFDVTGATEYTGVIASISGEGAGALTKAWEGPTVTAAYRMRYQADGSRATAQARAIAEQFAVVEANGRGLFFRFSDSVTDADPGLGYLRLNNPDPTAATAAYIDNLDASGATVSGEIDTWDDGGSTIKGRLWLRSIVTGSAFRSYAITGSVVDGTGYRKLTLAHVGGSGVFTAEDGLMAFFVPKGDKGDDGISAYQVALANGFVGSESAWLSSLEGSDGTNGDDGIDGTGLFSRVRAVDTTDSNPATSGYTNGAVIDGVTMATGDLVLRASASNPARNGIWPIVASGGSVRDSSFDTYDEHPGVYVSVMEGTANADTLWRCTSNKGGTLNTTGIVFSQFSSGAASSAPNLLDNACFGIAQRGTLFTSASTPANSDGALLLDRWVLLSDGNDIVDVGKETTTVPTAGGSAIYLEVETANKKFGLVQLLTSQRSGPLIGEKASFSFKARKGGSNATVDKLRAAIVTWSGTKDAPTKDVVSGTSWGAEGTNPTLATSWTYESTPIDLVLTTSYQEFKIENVDIDTASGKQVAVFIWCDNSDATVNDLVFISEAQLVKGASVPVFAPVTEAEDYSRCQAHLLRVTFASTGQRWVAGLVNNPSPVSASFGFSHAVPFWRPPDVSQSSLAFITATGVGGTNHIVTSVVLSYSAGNVTGFRFSAATADTYNLATAVRADATGAFIEFDAGIGI
jgi:hypothetical protein